VFLQLSTERNSIGDCVRHISQLKNNTTGGYVAKDLLDENMDTGAFSRLAFELDRIHSSERARPLHIYCVFPKISVEDLSSVASEAGVHATTERKGKGVYSLEIMSPKKRQLANGYLMDYGSFWNILIKTIELPTVAEHVARMWLRRMRPAEDYCRNL